MASYRRPSSWLAQLFQTVASKWIGIVLAIVLTMSIFTANASGMTPSVPTHTVSAAETTEASQTNTDEENKASIEKQTLSVHPASQPQLDARITHLVHGIIAYSQWPGNPKQLRLCVTGNTSYEAALTRTPLRLEHANVVAARLPSGSDVRAAECDVVYFGRLQPDLLQEMLNPLIGLPIMTIFENPPHCSVGNMFCINTLNSQPSFEVNLDSIARSGVKVSPWVLTLTAPSKGLP